MMLIQWKIQSRPPRNIHHALICLLVVVVRHLRFDSDIDVKSPADRTAMFSFFPWCHNMTGSMTHIKSYSTLCSLSRQHSASFNYCCNLRCWCLLHNRLYGELPFRDVDIFFFFLLFSTSAFDVFSAVCILQDLVWRSSSVRDSFSFVVVLAAVFLFHCWTLPFSLFLSL